jgi:hypothetical protein
MLLDDVPKPFAIAISADQRILGSLAKRTGAGPRAAILFRGKRLSPS